MTKDMAPPGGLYPGPLSQGTCVTPQGAPTPCQGHLAGLEVPVVDGTGGHHGQVVPVAAGAVVEAGVVALSGLAGHPPCGGTGLAWGWHWHCPALCSPHTLCVPPGHPATPGHTAGPQCHLPQIPIAPRAQTFSFHQPHTPPTPQPLSPKQLPPASQSPPREPSTTSSHLPSAPPASQPLSSAQLHEAPSPTPPSPTPPNPTGLPAHPSPISPSPNYQLPEPPAPPSPMARPSPPGSSRDSRREIGARHSAQR